MPFSSRSKYRSSASLTSQQSAASTGAGDQGRTKLARPAAAPPDSDVEKLAPSAGAEAAEESSPQTATPGPANSNLYDPRSIKFWTIMFCNFLALFLVALDRTILATAVPRITDEFRSLGDVGWYGSAYMLTTAASQLLFGRIYKFYPTKWTFLVCIIVFEIGSAICGSAPNSIVFIVGRAIAGLGSAGIFTGCMLMFMIVPLHRRPMFQGLFGLVFGIASVMGPLIGGAFTGGLSWRWCFWMNLPIGVVSFVVMMAWWNPPEQEIAPAPLKTHIKRLDPIGTLFLIPAVVALLLALQWGGSTYSWNSIIIIVLFVVFGVLILAFAAVQVIRPETATIPPRVITQRSVFFGTFFTFFVAGSMLMCVYFVPIWFQTAQGVDPLRSGIYSLPLVLSLVVSSVISGIFTQKIGYYVPSMLLSPSVMAVGTGLMTTFHPGSDSAQWITYQFLTGFGLGFGMQTAGLAVQTVLPLPDVSIGISINFFAQQLGGAVFTSVGQAILSNVLVAELSGFHDLDPESIVKAGITELLRAVPPEDAGLIANAYNYACTRIFLAAMGLTFGSLMSALCMEWRSIKKPKEAPGRPDAAAHPENDNADSGMSNGATTPIARQESMAKRDENGGVDPEKEGPMSQTRSGPAGIGPKAPPMQPRDDCLPIVVVDHQVPRINEPERTADEAFSNDGHLDLVSVGSSAFSEEAVTAPEESMSVRSGGDMAPENKAPKGPRKFWLLSPR